MRSLFIGGIVFLLSRNISFCLTRMKIHVFEGLRLFVMRLDVKGAFPFKSVAFVHVCVQEYKAKMSTP